MFNSTKHIINEEENEWKDFEKKLSTHDTHYEFSDDHSVYAKGHLERKDIDRQFYQLHKKDPARAKQLYLKHIPSTAMGGLSGKDPETHIKSLVDTGQRAEKEVADAKAKRTAELSHPRYKHGEMDEHTYVFHNLTGKYAEDIKKVDQAFEWHGKQEPYGRYSHRPEIIAKVGSHAQDITTGFAREHVRKGSAGPGSYYVRVRPHYSTLTAEKNKDIEFLGDVRPADHAKKLENK